jgi:hypothetical protein
MLLDQKSTHCLDGSRMFRKLVFKVPEKNVNDIFSFYFVTFKLEVEH